MLAQPKLFSWSTAKNRILNQLHYTATSHEDRLETFRRGFAIAPAIPLYPLFYTRVNLFDMSIVFE